MIKPKAEAIRLSKMLSAIYKNIEERFPVNVEKLALEYTPVISPGSYIADIKDISIHGFEGCLKSNKAGTKWLLTYNQSHGSPGRVRFTLAHELGHFMLHRSLQNNFECTERDMYDWDSPYLTMETEADTFASYLLMPLDDFRQQIYGTKMSIELLEHCRKRYGVSRMAAALKWIEIAPRRTLVVAARDGFLLWARMNEASYKSGVYLSTRKTTIEVPGQSLLADIERTGGAMSRISDARIWFPNEPSGMVIEETAISVEGPYPYVLGILQLPDIGWDSDKEDTLLEPLTSLDFVKK
jgi:Zn-dependent peptidase ImmA (M78 family)